MIGAGGLATSIIVFAVGAVLDYAVVASPDQHGFNVNKVGMILMIVGVVGAVLSVLACSSPTVVAVTPSLMMERAMSPVGSTRPIERINLDESALTSGQSAPLVLRELERQFVAARYVPRMGSPTYSVRIPPVGVGRQ